MRVGLGARLAIAFALLAAVTALVTAGVSAYSTSRQVNSDIDRFLRDRAADIAEGRRLDLAIGPPRLAPDRGRGPPRGDNETFEDILSLVESDAEVQLLSEDGEVVVTAGIVLPVADADLRLLNRGDSPFLRTVEIDGEQYRMISQHIKGGGVVQVAQSLSTTNELLGSLRTELLVVGFVMSGVAGLVGWGIASGTTKPLRRLTRLIEGVAATEDLSTPIALDRTDEIGRLSEEFDALLKTLGSSREQQHRLVQDAAHELRTPLTSVRANIDFLERAHDLDPDTRQSTLAGIKTELVELSSVLAEVVELATDSHDRGAYKDLDLVGVADAALAQFELRSARPVERSFASTLVHGDHAALVRAASNLIGNADKYSPPDLPITLHVHEGSLWVADRGPGIDPADRERVFDRFYRSDAARSAPGSGLGLAIVAKVASEHNGSAWARDGAGGGAEVGFTLPRVGR